MSELAIAHLYDFQITPAQDESLRALFKICFKRELKYLDSQRFFRELPPHRWIIFDEAGEVVAHIAVYEKILGSDAGLLPVIGIAEVCVDPAHRGRGCVRALLGEIHDWARAQGFNWSMLFGASGIYASSGYKSIDNSIRSMNYQTGEWETEIVSSALVCPLGEAQWPDGPIDLRGPHF